MDYIEVSGKNVDEALTNALIKLETTSDKVEYEVIEKGSSGILGLFNKPAVIRVRRKAEAKEQEPVYVQEVKEDSKLFDIKQEQPKVVNKKPSIINSPKKEVEYNTVKSEPVNQTSTTHEVIEQSAKPVEKVSKYTTVMSNDEIEKRIRTFLNDMFKAMGMEVKIDIDFDDPECVNIEFSGENMGVLIGKRGQTLDSIQYLTSLVVNKGKDKYVRIKIDTEDYRNRRKQTLESLARNIAYKVKRSRKPVSLEPMNPYERRIIHSALQGDKFVSTRSEGEEPFRHVVVYLDRERNSHR